MGTFPSSMHVHSHYSDGIHSPEDMILAAIGRGFTSIGLAEHAYAPHDLDVCVPKDKMQAYRTEVLRLAEKYAGEIEISCGLEIDFYGIWERGGWGHIVGSVHYVQCRQSGKFYVVDDTAEILEQCIDDVGGGSVQRFVEAYAENVLQLVGRRPDIIGHIDLITKLNSGNRFFDPGAGWYKAVWEKVAPAIAASGCVTEVNTGAMSRGYTDTPYPAPDLLRMLHSHGAPLTLCSDAHDKDMLDYAYDQALQLIREAGYNSLKLWRGGKFVDFEI